MIIQMIAVRFMRLNPETPEWKFLLTNLIWVPNRTVNHFYSQRCSKPGTPNGSLVWFQGTLKCYSIGRIGYWGSYQGAYAVQNIFQDMQCFRLINFLLGDETTLIIREVLITVCCCFLVPVITALKPRTFHSTKLIFSRENLKNALIAQLAQAEIGTLTKHLTSRHRNLDWRKLSSRMLGYHSLNILWLKC